MSYIYRRLSCHFAALTAIAVVAGLHAGSARANATGGSVVAGQGTINQAGGTTTISQQSPTLILNWQGFSISPSETVQFVQPAATSIALNRVIGNAPSEIYGHLLANGQVFLVNPNGVLFGPGAKVDVGGLVASSLGLSNADFLSGNYRFQGSVAPASVVNQGDITASGGGSVALLGGQVINQGVIRAQLGTVALAGGSAVTLDFVGNHLLNVQVAEGAAEALAANHQLIQADGGTVIMTAAARDALLQTVVNNDGVIEARTIQNQGGKIELLGSQDGGTVQVGGTLDASAPSGGNGGNIETSGANVDVANSAHITTAAADGETGMWLLDPTNITVAPSGGTITGAALSTDLSTTNFGLTSGGDIDIDDTVSWSSSHTLTMSAAGNINMPASGSSTNGSLTVSGSGGISMTATGNINISKNNSITLSGSGATLSMSAANININGSITASGSGDNVTMNYGTGDNYFLGPGAQVTLSGSTPSLSIEGNSYTVITSVGVDNDTSKTTLEGINNNLSGYYALGTDIDASATSGWTTWPGFEPIGAPGTGFTGMFAGLGHVISNLTTGYSQPGVGVFGYVAAASTIRDVGLTGGSISSPSSSNQYIGSLVGENYGTISNSYSSMSVTGGTDVGGLVGANYGTITGSNASGAVTGTNNVVGGLVGDNEAGGSVTSSYATGTVDGENYTAGGLAGYNAGSISDSYASGSVSAVSGIDGGLVGNNLGSISDSYASGSVTSYWNEGGGLVGWNEAAGTIETSYYVTGTVNGGSSADIGGLIGENDGSIAQSFASAVQVIGGTGVGGLVGVSTSTASITNSYATGQLVELTSSGDIGGLVGDNSGSISDTYAAVSLIGNEGHGFLGGTDNGTITDSYWLKTGAMQDSSTAVPLTAAQSQQEASYVGWNFTPTTGTWRIYDGHTMPLLEYFLTPLTITTTGILVYYDGVAWDNTPLSTPVYSIPGAATSGHLDGLASPYAGDINAGTYTPDLWSDQLGYDISVTPNSLTIDPSDLEITISDVTKTYDGTTSVVGGVPVATGGTQLFGSDSLSGGVFTYTNANAGTGKTVTVGGVTVNDGNGGNNYTITNYVDNTTSTITPAPLDVTTANVTKTYDGTTAVVGGSLVATDGTQLFGSDTLSGGVFAYTNADAGSGKTVTVSGVTVNDGNGGNNYDVTDIDNTTSTIEQALLTVSGITAQSKSYDGTTSATLDTAGATLAGKISGDDVGISGVGSFADPNAGIDKTVTLSLALTGTASSNYVLAGTGSETTTTASISPDALTITADDASRVTGQPNPPFTLSYSGFVAGQTTSSLTTLPTVWTTASTNSPAGTYPISVSGAADPNYVFTYVPAVLTVTDGGPAAQAASPSYVGALASVSGSDGGGGLGPSDSEGSTSGDTSTGIVCAPGAGANCAKAPDVGNASTGALGRHFSGLSLEIIADGIRLPAGVQ